LAAKEEGNSKESDSRLILCQNDSAPKILTFDFAYYYYKLTPEDQKHHELMEEKFSMNLEKGLVSISDWFVEEDHDYWYFISRYAYQPENKNVMLKMDNYVCFSDISGSKYTKGLEFMSDRDPLLEKGSEYLFEDIKIGFMVQVNKKTKGKTRIPYFYSFYAFP
jgi:hypothetical protein